MVQLEVEEGEQRVVETKTRRKVGIRRKSTPANGGSYTTAKVQKLGLKFY